MNRAVPASLVRFDDDEEFKESLPVRRAERFGNVIPIQPYQIQTAQTKNIADEFPSCSLNFHVSSGVRLCIRHCHKIKRIIEKFIRNKTLFLFYPNQSEYQIYFEPAAGPCGREVHCRIFIQVSSKQWTGTALSKAPLLSFQKAFRNLSPYYSTYEETNIVSYLDSPAFARAG